MFSKRTLYFILAVIFSTIFYFGLDYYKSISYDKAYTKLVANEKKLLQTNYSKIYSQNILRLYEIKNNLLKNYNFIDIIKNGKTLYLNSSLFENSYITVYDTNYNTKYSTTPLENRSLIRKSEIENKLETLMGKTPQLMSDDTGLYLESIQKVYDNNDLVGYILIQLNFTFIQSELEKNGIYFIMLLNEDLSHTININVSFSKNFLNKYHVVNSDVNKYYLKILEDMLPQLDKKDSYYNKDIIICKEEIWQNGKLISIAYILKASEELDTQSISFNELLMNIILGFFILFIFILFFYLSELDYMKQYKIENKDLLDENEHLKSLADKLDYNEKKLSNLFNLQPNLMFISNGINIVQVNKRFMGFFRRYETLENFKESHNDISELFEDTKEPNYITQYLIEGQYWLEYILEHPKKVYKTIMSVDKEPHHFIIKVNEMKYVKNYKERYIVVAFVDITQEIQRYQTALPKANQEETTDITYIIEDSISIIIKEMTELIPTRNSIFKATLEDINDKKFLQAKLDIQNSNLLQWKLLIPAVSASVISNLMEQKWDAYEDSIIDQEIIDTVNELVEQFAYNIVQTISLYNFDDLQIENYSVTSSQEILWEQIELERLYKFSMFLEDKEIEVFIEFDEYTLEFTRQLVMLGLLFD